MTPREAVFVVAVAAVLAVASGCAMAAGGSPSTSAAADPGASTTVELTVYGAASLKEALAAVATAYEIAVPGTALTIATDSSATLRAQIEQGAPADLFLSADEQNPQALVDARLTDGAAVDFASNTLVIVVPLDNPAGIATPADLARPGVKIVAAGDEVPISGYARQLVDRLAALDGYPADFASAYAANVVSKEENVKAVVAKIELGEADAAIAYVTDAAASSGRVAAIAIPPGVNVAADYAGVVVKASPHAAAAHTFLDWLAGPGGSAILATFEFGPPG
ncbi:MAG TPA: molybdate ABC transporter substrate-binding protein [Candidatus Limnocylindrales bacterium]|nr:molybdate ABC transporter substrate-binding protein [Candidatus Limnocylindrales bacterium]